MSGMLIKVAQTLIADSLMRYPQIRHPAYINHDRQTYNTHVDSPTSSSEQTAYLFLFDQLLTKARSIEYALTESGDALEDTFTYGHTITSDSDGNIKRYPCGIIHDLNHARRVGFKTDAPFVRMLVLAKSQRPLGDVIRVSSYLISFASQMVSFNTGFSSLLSQLVSFTIQLVSEYGNKQSSKSCQSRNHDSNQRNNIHESTPHTEKGKLNND